MLGKTRVIQVLTETKSYEATAEKLGCTVEEVKERLELHALQKADRQNVLDVLSKTKSYAKTARIVGISRQRVEAIAIDAGCGLNTRIVTKRDLDRVIDVAKDCWSIREIARTLDISVQRAHTLIKRLRTHKKVVRLKDGRVLNRDFRKGE